jgi:hypothetical protein
VEALSQALGPDLARDSGVSRPPRSGRPLDQSTLQDTATWGAYATRSVVPDGRVQDRTAGVRSWWTKVGRVLGWRRD